jgi:hypothetical protein
VVPKTDFSEEHRKQTELRLQQQLQKKYSDKAVSFSNGQFALTIRHY